MGSRQSFWDSRPDSSQVIQHTFITKMRDKYCELHKDYSFQLGFCFSLSGPILHSFSASVLITIAAGRDSVLFESMESSTARQTAKRRVAPHPLARRCSGEKKDRPLT